MADRSEEHKLFKAVRDGDKDAFAALQAEAENGNSHAQFLVGRKLLIPRKECVKGVKWLQKAGNEGHATAQLSLAGIYRFGCGPDVSVDYKQAYYWELLAQKTSHEYPKLPGRLSSDQIPDDFGIPEAIEVFQKNLTIDEIAAIRKRVGDWKLTSAPDENPAKP